MPTLDVFNSDAFSCRSLTAAIESRDGVLTLIQTDQRGAPPVNRTTEKRKVRGFKTVRLAKQDKLFASELQGIRAFGSESELMQVQAEIMRRYAGPTGILRDLELTWENHRLGAVQGVVLDADGSTITNWFTEFGVTQDAEIDFDLDNAAPASGAVRKLCNTVVRQMQRAAKGAWTSSTRIMGICGDAFWDDLTAHSEVRQTYLNTQQAAALREGIAWETFNYGGITWTNYRGTDDGSTIAVGTDKAKFFPVGAPGVFQVAMSPGESFDVVNTPGRPVYGMIVPDRDRNMFASIEAYSYPLYICTRPLMLQRGKRT